MTTLYLSPIGSIVQFLNNLGVPLSGGRLNLYVGGSVNTLQTSYTDATGTTQNANPLVLNSAGRMAASTAPVSVWVPANTPHKMVLTDSASNVLWSLDGMLGINDPTAIIASLQTSGGVASIPNAVGSCDIFSTLRTYPVPALAAGVTMVVILQGGTAIGDGVGGAFYWDSASAAADDNVNVIKLTASGTSAGRFLRLLWNAKFGLDDANATQTLGWRDCPQNIQNANYAVVLADRGKQIYHSNGSPHTWTIPANAAVAFPIGTVIDLVNDNGGGAVTIAITTDTLRWAPIGSTGPRTLAANGTAQIKKITATSWQISGVNLT